MGSPSMGLYGEQLNDLLYVGFNQDKGCFACGTDSGFRVFNVDPFREAVWRSFANGGIGIVEMLFRCNLIALVGGGKNPRYPTNKVFIWDDHQSRNIGELTFKTEVKAVKLRRDRVVVVLMQKVYVYRFSDLKMVDHISTIVNPKGLVSLCADNAHNVLAVPGTTKGSVRIELYDINKASLIQAHETDMSVFELNMDGSKIATASEKGTLIRLWDCGSGEPLRELRRGVDRAEIYCLAFNPLSTYLACSSDKGTVHIFSLSAATTPLPNAAPGGPVGRSSDLSTESSSSSATMPGAPQPSALTAMPPPPGPTGSDANAGSKDTNLGSVGDADSSDKNGTNVRSGLNFMKSMLPGLVPKYFASEWSCAQIRGIESKSICAFDKDSTKILVVCADGTFLTYNFEDKQGECQRLSNKRFVKDPGELPDNVITSNSVPMSTSQQEGSPPTATSTATGGKPGSGTSSEPPPPSPDPSASH